MSIFNKKSALKKAVSFLVVICMMLGAMPSLAFLTVHADETPEADTADVWDGTADTSWYNGYDSEYIIYTAEELAGLAYLVNNGNTFSGITIHLGNNLDLAGLEWTPIGVGSRYNYYGAAFKGVFDGNFHTIYGLQITNTTSSNVGLFGTAQNANIQNVAVVEAFIDVAQYDTVSAGVLIGTMDATEVYNVLVSGDVTIQTLNSGVCFVGLAVGYVYSGTGSRVSDVSAIGNVYGYCSGYNSYVGGVVGAKDYSGGTLTMNNCFFNGTVGASDYDSHSYAGGILGISCGGESVQNCIFIGEIYSDNTRDAIVDYFASATYSNCYYSADFVSSRGILASLTDFQSQSWIETNLGWDFGAVWEFEADSDYPVLQGFSDGGYTPHVHEYVLQSATVADCVNDGTETYSCTICARTYSTVVESALGHNYENGECTVCGESIIPVYTLIESDSSYSVDIIEMGGSVYFKFVPECSGIYQFYSSNNASDTYGALLDENGDTLYYDDDSGDGNNFSITYECIADTTYFIRAYFYSSSSTGSYTLNVATIELYCDHEYVLQGTTAADCYNDGYATYVCTLCGDTYNEWLEYALGHDYVLQITTIADCVNDGVEIYSCSRCNDTYEIVVEYAYGHIYENGECTVCGESVIPAYTDIESNASYYVNISESYGAVYFKFVPTASGRYRFYSTDRSGDPRAALLDECGNQIAYDDDGGSNGNFSLYYDCEANTTYYIKAYMWSDYSGSYTFNVETIYIYCDHEYVLQGTTAADCYNDGYATYVCTLCGDTYNEWLEYALGHDYVLQITTIADCVNDGVEIYSCSRCNDTYEIVVEYAYGHTYENGECTVCGESIIPVYTLIESDSSSYVIISESYGAVYFKFVPTASGQYRFYSINYSGDPYAELYDANGNYLTSNDDGGEGWNFSIYYDCEANTVYYIRAIMNGSNTGSYTFNVETIYIYCDHEYVLQGTTAADCYNDGYATYVCTLCGDTYNEWLEYALGHDYVLQITTIADCVNDGVEIYSCSRCNDTYEIVVEYAYGHTYENGECTMCGESMIPVYTLIESDSSYSVDIIEMGGSVYFKFVPECSGIYQFYSSNNASDTYGALLDENGDTLYYDDDSGDGNNFSITYECIADTTYFIRAYFYSSSSTGSYTLNVATIELYCDHDYVLQSATVADCVNDGVETYACVRCNDTYNEVVAPKLGHDYVDGECTRCGSVRRGIVLLVEDNLPWGSNANSVTLQRLVDEGIIEGYEKHSSDDLVSGSVNIYDYALVVLAADQEQSFYNNISIDDLAAYAQSGGSIFLAADTCGYSSGRYSVFPFGITSTRNNYDYNYIVDGTHPMITGIYSDNHVLQNSDMYGSAMSHNSFTNYPENTNVILTNTSGDATLIEFEYGQGLVVVSGLTFECAYKHSWNFFEGYDDILIHLYSRNSGNHTPHIHSYVETSHTEPTCTTDGRVNYTCSCGATRVEIVGALGHNIESIIEIQVTCTTDGLIVDRCTNGGCSYEKRTTIHGEHNYSITDRQEAACNTPGYIEYTCSNCNDKQYEYFEGKHNYVESSRVEAQVEVEGSITYTCTYCYDSYSIVIPALTPVLKNSSVLLIQDSLPWAEDVNTALLEALKERGVVSSYNIISTRALDTYDLSQYGVVFIANDQSSDMYERLAANAEKLENYVRAGGNLIYGACDSGWGGCGSLTHTLPGGVVKSNYYSVYNYIVNDLHPIVTGIYTDNRSLREELLKGNYCSHTYFEASSLPEGTDIILRDGNGNPTLIEYSLGDGTVIASGLTWEYFYVRDHYDMVTNYSKYAYDDLVTYMVYISNTCEHNYEMIETVEATCEENGYTLYVCTLCSYEYKSNVVAALGHSYVETSRTEPTCTIDGGINYTCSCGSTVVESIPALGHSYVETSRTEPTCVDMGMIYYTCACGEVETETLGYAEHVSSDWIVDTESTAIQTGLRHKECTVCQTVLETEIIPVSAKLVISDVEAEAGSIVKVTIDIQNNPGILGAALTLYYDSALTLIDAEAGIAWSGLTLTKPSVFTNSCNFVWDGIAADYGDGTVIVLTFILPDDADIGMVYNISASYTYGNIIDADLEAVDVEIENGTITVADLLGDVNDDGIVNVVDVITLRRYIAGGYGVEIDEIAADIDGSGHITVADIVLLRRLLVG